MISSTNISKLSLKCTSFLTHPNAPGIHTMVVLRITLR
jgi:hypothetical protein